MIPDPTEKDFQWATRLWNTLVVGDESTGQQGGIWDMPMVGRYQRTGENELTFTHIMGDVMKEDILGTTLFDKHEWIKSLAQGIGWVIIDEVVNASMEEYDDPAEPALVDIGKVWVCPGCSLIYTVRGIDCPERVLVEGVCLNTKCGEVLPEHHRGVFNHVDDTALVAKMEATERLIAIDEGDYPPRPIEPLGEDIMPFEGQSEEE